MKFAEAVINIGSNSVKLLCPTEARFGKRSIITTQLALGQRNGALALDAVERTAAAVKELYDAALFSGYRAVCVYATEAVRSAANGNLLIDKVYSLTGLTVDVLTGKEEALTSYLGAKAVSDGFDALLDVGGGSTELIAAEGNKIKFSLSLPVGAVRLYERYGQDYDALLKEAHRLTVRFGAVKCGVLAGVSGTFNALAAIDLSLNSSEPEAIHGHEFTPSSLSALTSRLLKMSADEVCRKYPAVGYRRSLVLRAGLAIVNSVADVTAAKKIIISAGDGLNGYLEYKNSYRR